LNRTVLTEGDGLHPRAISVQPGQVVGADIVAQCADHFGSSIIAQPTSSVWSTAPMVYNGATDGSGFGVADRFGTGDTLYYKITHVSGRLELHALGYSLYAPVDTDVTLLDASGRRVDTQQSDDVYVGTSGFRNYDSALVATDLPSGDYTVRVTAQSMSYSAFPGGPTAVDTVPFVLLTGSVNEGTPALASVLPVNGRCRMEENFASYASPPGPPPRGHKEDDEKTGFCGTLSDENGGGGNGGGPSLPTIVGWLLPWFFMGAAVQGMRIAHSRGPLVT
jgi:hypothetical protein